MLKEIKFKDKSLAFIILILIYILICGFSVAGFTAYKGQGAIYILFSIVSNGLLYFGFRKNAIFFDAFIGVFFWLGFWLKLTIRIIFMGGVFHEAVGNFDGSGAAFDNALLVSVCGFLGLITISFIREKLIFTYPIKAKEDVLEGLFKVYQHNRNIVLIGFVLFFFTIAITNIYFGIYQRGAVPRTILPFGLSGIYKWLLLFGLASFSALILKFEFSINKKTPYLVVLLSLLEGFISNVSLLSRGMILNTSALVFGLSKSLKSSNKKTSFGFISTAFLAFVLLFSSSVLVVNFIRSDYNSTSTRIADLELITVSMGAPLFLDRWVGIEGVMAVSSYPDLGWNLWKDAWKETYSEKTMTFYDTNMITSPYINLYKNIEQSNYHYVSLPGVLAFCFYPGSYVFLFWSMFVVGLIATIIEMSVYRLGGQNVILCSLLAQVVAYRFSSFGYVPGQSYLLFGSIYFNLFIIYYANKFVVYCHNRNTRAQ